MVMISPGIFLLSKVEMFSVRTKVGTSYKLQWLSEQLTRKQSYKKIKL